MRWIVTGGAGFIGSHFVRTALSEGWADDIVVFDALTYAGNLRNLDAVADDPRWRLVRGRVQDERAAAETLADGADAIFHFAAESHVDRSIVGAHAFVQTNILGTQVWLDAARARGVPRFIHVSTDEVYGALGLGDAQRFTEDTPLAPTSPYAASKAASDLLVLAAARTHGLDAVVTRCSNNYGPYQHPEKFLPRFIINALEGRPMPLFGDGLNVRDWIDSGDHVRGVYAAYCRGRAGEVYNFGGACELNNRCVAEAIARRVGVDPALIVPVADRAAHDRRYAVNFDKACHELNFVTGPGLLERLPGLVAWYDDNRAWWQPMRRAALKDISRPVRHAASVADKGEAYDAMQVQIDARASAVEPRATAP